MKLFTCQHCGQLLYFENTGCERCGRALGFLPELATLSALEPDGELWRALAAPAKRYRACANAVYDACNWQVEADVRGRLLRLVPAQPHRARTCRCPRTSRSGASWSSPRTG